MIRAYRYLCYWLFYDLKHSIFNWDAVDWSASGIMSLAMTLNVLAAFLVVETVTGFHVRMDSHSIPTILFGALLFLLHLRLFSREKRDQMLEKEFGPKPDVKNSKGKWIAPLYVFGSYCLFFLVLILEMAVRGESSIP